MKDLTKTIEVLEVVAKTLKLDDKGCLVEQEESIFSNPKYLYDMLAEGTPKEVQELWRSTSYYHEIEEVIRQLRAIQALRGK